MEYRLLGPLEVEREGRVLPLGGPKQRAVLAVLLLRRGTTVPADLLIDEIWGESAPATVRNALQGYVFQLRKVLEPDLARGQPHHILRSDGAGYRLEIGPEELDLDRFATLAAHAVTSGETNPGEAVSLLNDALALWRGPPLAEFAYEPFAQAAIAKLEEDRLAAVEAKLEFELELGRHEQVVGELEELARAHPHRERPHALLMLALYRSGRHAEALHVYRTLRERLDDELGLAPSAELQTLERRILQQDAGLDGDAATRERLPQGTVTLLFTDIEGSTRLLDELGADEYAVALAEHRRSMREAFGRHQGVEVDTQGDALFFAFVRAQDALAAAAAAQAAQEEGAIRVRIGIHTGEPIVSDGGYVGLDVPRAARIMAAGNGGQVVVSETTRGLVAGEIELRDLGVHRLKDMTAPQHLYQLGDGDFPPLRSLNRTNLPVQPTPLVGRQRELGELSALLGRDDVRLLTLTGPGGTGKTRLSLQAAASAAERLQDGVFWVSLAPLADPELVVTAVARALDVAELPGETLEQTLAGFLESRGPLIVLDNFEHVLAARALVAALLTASPTVRFLVTSRTELSLSGEYVYPVAPLPQEDAVSLFVERAAQVGVAVSVDPTVAAICERLDRLPLAIELAAARVKLLAPAGLLDRLDVRLPMLRGGAADLPPRQQTLHAAIAWSHDLLDQDERVLFRRLSVFAGSFTLESAEAVADSDLWTLESLLSKSLVRRWSSDRFGLLETIREYAREQLEDAGESERFAAAHAQHYLDLALSLEPYLAAGDRRSDSTDQLATEFDNLRAALVHFESSDHGEQLLQLATALWRFWMARGYFGTGREWLERGLEIAEDASDDLRARALEGLGVMCMLGGDVDEGVRVTESALDLFRKLGDARGTAESLNNIGTAVMSNLDLERAERLFLEAADVARSAGELQVVALAIGNLAAVAVERGDDDGAIQLLNEETQIYSQVGDRGRVAMPLLTLGRMLVDQGRTGEAVRPLASGLAAADELPQREFAVMGVVTVAALAGGEGDGILAAQLLGAVDGLYEAAGASWRSSIPADRATRERAFERARKSAENDAFDVAYAAGRGLSFEQAIATALTALERLEDCESATAASTPRRSSPS